MLNYFVSEKHESVKELMTYTAHHPCSNFLMQTVYFSLMFLCLGNFIKLCVCMYFYCYEQKMWNNVWTVFLYKGSSTLLIVFNLSWGIFFGWWDVFIVLNRKEFNWPSLYMKKTWFVSKKLNYVFLWGCTVVSR